MGCFFCSLLIIKLGSSFSDLTLVLLDCLLSLQIVSIGMLEGNFKLSDIRFKLLLHPQGFSFALSLLLKSRLHAFNSLGHIFLDAQELFILLSNPVLDLLSDLSELKLSTQDLVLLLLKSTFGLLKSCLKFKFLSLKTFPNFVNLMNGSSTFADLIHDILDLIA